METTITPIIDLDALNLLGAIIAVAPAADVSRTHAVLSGVALILHHNGVGGTAVATDGKFLVEHQWANLQPNGDRERVVVLCVVKLLAGIKAIYRRAAKKNWTRTRLAIEVGDHSLRIVESEGERELTSISVGFIDGTYPPYQQALSPTQSLDEPVGPAEIGFDSHYLGLLEEVFGKHAKLRFDFRGRGALISPIAPTGTRALLMPVTLPEIKKPVKEEA